MDTLWMLMGCYQGMPIVPIAVVVKDFFSHLTPAKFQRKIADGNIKLPLVRMEDSQKSAKGVDLRDLATYLDERRAEALRECHQLHG